MCGVVLFIVLFIFFPDHVSLWIQAFICSEWSHLVERRDERKESSDFEAFVRLPNGKCHVNTRSLPNFD